jgi:hypothetical protein
MLLVILNQLAAKTVVQVEAVLVISQTIMPLVLQLKVILAVLLVMVMLVVAVLMVK